MLCQVLPRISASVQKQRAFKCNFQYLKYIYYLLYDASELPTYRPSENIRMPRFVPRQRKQRVLRRSAKNGASTNGGADTNTMEILPSEQTEKEKLRLRLKDEIRAQQPQMSSKKQKRLDKYIVNFPFNILGNTY